MSVVFHKKAQRKTMMFILGNNQAPRPIPIKIHRFTMKNGRLTMYAKPYYFLFKTSAHMDICRINLQPRMKTPTYQKKLEYGMNISTIQI